MSSREFSVTCFCAEWCDLCVDYRPGFLALAARFPQAEFRWVDIEDEPPDFDVENFNAPAPRRAIHEPGCFLFRPGRSSGRREWLGLCDSRQQLPHPFHCA